MFTLRYILDGKPIAVSFPTLRAARNARRTLTTRSNATEIVIVQVRNPKE